jgi:hypothetical protein
VTSSTAVAPAGITTPLDPDTASARVAVMRSPTLLVLVQTRCPELSERLVPAETTPTVPSVLPPVEGALTTVLPEGVVTGAGARVTGDGAGAGAGVRLRGGGATATRRFSTTAARGGAGGGVVGTSLSCGCAAVSLFASWRSRESDESCARGSWPDLLSPLLHAATVSSAAAQIAAGRIDLIEFSGSPSKCHEISARGD